MNTENHPDPSLPQYTSEPKDDSPPSDPSNSPHPPATVLLQVENIPQLWYCLFFINPHPPQGRKTTHRLFCVPSPSSGIQH